MGGQLLASRQIHLLSDQSDFVPSKLNDLGWHAGGLAVNRQSLHWDLVAGCFGSRAGSEQLVTYLPRGDVLAEAQREGYLGLSLNQEHPPPTPLG